MKNGEEVGVEEKKLRGEWKGKEVMLEESRSKY